MEPEKESTQILVMAGGEAKRLGLNMPKALVKLGDTTLIDRCVELYVRNGFHDFVFALGHGDKEVTEHIHKRNWKGLRTSIIYDYEKNIGSGKAIKKALMDGKIDKAKRFIYAQPDDMYLDPQMPSKVLKEHMQAVQKLGVVASDVVEKAHRYPFGVARTDRKGIITEFEEKPLVPLLTATGIRVFEPKSYSYFMDGVDLDKEGPVGFEYEILPRLAKDRKIYAIVIPVGTWVTINTQKDLEQAQKLVSEGVLPKS